MTKNNKNKMKAQKKMQNKKNLNVFSNAFISFRNLSIVTQLLSCYIFLYIIFAFIIIIIKVYQTNTIINSEVKSNYYQELIENTLMSQREIKAFVDKLNYQDELDSGTRHLIFNVFLINEFKSKDFFLVNKDIKDFPFHIWSLNQFKLPAYFDSFENDYNLKFKNGINNLREYYVDYFENSIKPTDSSPVIMPNVYFPILISFIPIIVQELDFNGIIIDNYDFLMYQSGCEPNVSSIYL